ncbi:ArsR/SmtB family transcription factor [Novosphingobium barchaimii]|uniref:ArsR/SmtB family transcription factor n=1 Tax=Novosphingobium barchaimii TaxID=1420591 RepID=UPI0009E889C7|nr:metalloregulator ArsR/SmtB family transcription factor [Novosphingobium barchaimii]
METESVVSALGALAQDTRLATINLLVHSGPDGLPAGEIARSLGIPKNTLSSHLNILSVGGIVTSERQSRHIVYRINKAALRDLSEYLIALHSA